MRGFIVGFLLFLGLCCFFVGLFWFFVQGDPAEQSAGRKSDPGFSGDQNAKSVWLATPPFMVRDASNAEHRIVAAFQFRNQDEAEEICVWMPLIIDRMNMITDRMKGHGASYQPLFSFAKRKLKRQMQEITEDLKTVDLNIIDLDAPNLEINGPNNPRLACDRGVLDGRRSKLFTG